MIIILPTIFFDGNMVFSATVAGVPGSYQQLLKAKHWIKWSWMKDIDFHPPPRDIYICIYIYAIYNTVLYMDMNAS